MTNIFQKKFLITPQCSQKGKIGLCVLVIVLLRQLTLMTTYCLDLKLQSNKKNNKQQKQIVHAREKREEKEEKEEE